MPQRERPKMGTTHETLEGVEDRARRKEKK